MKRSTGNWAEDLGDAILFMLRFAIAAAILIPILIAVIIYLVVTR